MEKKIMELNTGTVDILLVDLPPDAIVDAPFYEEGYNPVLDYELADINGNIIDGSWATVELPEGFYNDIGWSDELTEEQAKGLVKRSGFSIDKMKYWNYMCGEFTYLGDALPSWRSFLSANNITERVYILRLIK